MAFHHGPAGAAHAVAMLLQTGRHLEFVVEDFLAKPMRVSAAVCVCAQAAPEVAAMAITRQSARTMIHFLIKAAQKTRRARQHSEEWGHIATRD